MNARRIRPIDLISYELAERIIEAPTSIDFGAPVEAVTVARLLAEARADATDEELAAEPQAIAQFRTTISAPPLRHSFVSSWQRRAAVLVAAVAVMFGGFGVAAAANGNLPAPLQRLAHNNLGHLGIDIPNSHVPTPKPDLNHGVTISSLAQDPGATGLDKGQKVCAAASRDRCRDGLKDSRTTPSTTMAHESGRKGTPATPGTKGTPTTPAAPAAPSVQGRPSSK